MRPTDLLARSFYDRKAATLDRKDSRQRDHFRWLNLPPPELQDACDFEIAFQPRKLFEDNPPLRLSHNFPTSWCNICHVPSGMGGVDWHNPPQRLLVLWLSGEVEFEMSDGDVRRLPAGSVVLAEDTSGKGHISRHPPEGQLVVHVALADYQSFARSTSGVGTSHAQ
jgi:hypothetical protein